MATSFGEQLRRAREARGISLREISEQTRISTRYLEAIEADDYKRLPGGIFNRSFIKAYAKHVGFDEKEALEAYARLSSEQGVPSDEVVTTPHRPRVYTDGNSTRSPLVTMLLTVLILAILSLGVYAALHWYQRRAATQASTNAPAASELPPATKDPAPSPAATAPATTNMAGAGFNIQIKAVGEPVWIKVRPDDGNATEAMLQPNETREFKPEQSLKILYYRLKAKALEVTINGRPTKVPPEMKGKMAELTITKGDYERLLQ